MTDYKRLKVTEPESTKQVIYNTLGAVGFILAMGALLFLRGLV